MDDLVVGQRKNVILGAVVAHGKSHAVVVALAHDRIQLHVLAEVMHPAHVPLEVKSKAAVLGLGRDLGPRCGLLSDREETGMCAMDHGVEMFEELDRVEVFVSAVLVGQPMAVLLAVVEIQHGGDSVNTDAVDVELLDPVENIGDQEVADLVLGEVENSGTPVGVFAAAGIRIFKDALTVESGKAVCIRAEVRRHPVQNNADSGIVQLVDHIHEVIGCSIARCRRIVTRDLISPGAVEGVL